MGSKLHVFIQVRFSDTIDVTLDLFFLTRQTQRKGLARLQITRGGGHSLLTLNASPRRD